MVRYGTVWYGITWYGMVLYTHCTPTHSQAYDVHASDGFEQYYYKNNADEAWSSTFKGATSLRVEFDERSATRAGE